MDTRLPATLLLDAYRRGIFPMAEEGEVLWFSPQKRGILPLDERFHIPHGLRRALRKKPFELRADTAFREVMLGCAQRPSTWIDSGLVDSYCALHESGHAHSFECWDDEGLQGGLYGVSLGGAFFGESMFSRKTDASKIALTALVSWLRARGATLLDTQWLTPHLATFGGYEIPRATYLRLLGQALLLQPDPALTPARHLAGHTQD